MHPHSSPQALGSYRIWEKGLCRCDQVKDFTIKRLSQIIQVVLNAVLGVLIRRRQKEMLLCWKRRNLTRKAETGVMWPQAKGGWQPPGTERGKDRILPQNLQRECGLAKNLNISSVI